MEMQISFEGKHQFAHSSGQYTGAGVSVFTVSFTLPVVRDKSSNCCRKSIQTVVDIIHSMEEVESICKHTFLQLIHFPRHLCMPQIAVSPVLSSVAMQPNL